MNRKLKISLWVILSLVCFNLSAFAKKEVVIDNGKKIKMHFTMKSEGAVLESTEGKEPFEFTLGQNPMIPGLEQALKGLKAGDKKQVSLTPQNAFGEVNPKAVVEFPKTQFKEKEIQPGMVFNGQGQGGVPLRGMVKEVKKDSVVLDFNHPLAGKNLDIDFEVTEVV